MWPDWIVPPLSQLIEILVKAVIVYLAVVVYTRLSGLRSFSKMSGFDFAMTVAIGSCIATTVLTADMAMIQGVVGIGALYLLQMSVAKLRLFTSLDKAIDNQPKLLMYEGEILEDNLDECRVSRGDLRSKLREANVLELHEAKAVVFEATGDVSVLHSSDDDADIDDWLLDGVRGAEPLVSKEDERGDLDDRNAP